MHRQRRCYGRRRGRGRRGRVLVGVRAAGGAGSEGARVGGEALNSRNREEAKVAHRSKKKGPSIRGGWPEN